MHSLIDRFFNKTSKNQKQNSWKTSFVEEFNFQPEHQWIVQDKNTKDAFNQLWEMLPSSIFEYLHRQSIIFMKSNDYRHSGERLHNFKNTVVVFPEYEKLLKSNKNFRVAFLAHELAFVLYELENEGKDPLLAEVEADKFVVDIGLADELERFLLNMDECSEKRLRLTYLTLKVFGIS